eukprot:CAMPEP_0174232118 /NCGR_PEP_ID=MMETSP0417-20130205/2496_1 /TAXON_ID=242541 /ORGANISM="Mayorella sp, Strain BSH-02190019" /LENGTH=277 /DNA_ID=CAMNT_0015310113 /DNA_START=90 /DNA_END=923 /DNA_ORIENTATION=-
MKAASLQRISASATKKSNELPRRWQVFFLPTEDTQQPAGRITAFCPFSGVLVHAANETEAAARWADEAHRLWLAESRDAHSPLHSLPPTHTAAKPLSERGEKDCKEDRPKEHTKQPFVLPTRLLSRKVWFGPHAEDHSPVYVIDFAFARDVVIAVCPKQDRTLALPSEWRRSAGDLHSEVGHLIPSWVIDLPVRCTPIMMASDRFSAPPAFPAPSLPDPLLDPLCFPASSRCAPLPPSAIATHAGKPELVGGYHSVLVRHNGQGRLFYTSLTPHYLN